MCTTFVKKKFKAHLLSINLLIIIGLLGSFQVKYMSIYSNNLYDYYIWHWMHTNITSIKFHINAGSGGDMTGQYERVLE